jgi:hypothetical protein
VLSFSYSERAWKRGMTNVDAARFAADWIEAWNSHDLDRIVSHYADNIVFLSPLAKQRMGQGRVVGVPALRAYWGNGLKAQPNLKFELIEVLTGYESLTIHYRNHRGQGVAETVEFGTDGKVVRSFACYA